TGELSGTLGITHLVNDDGGVGSGEFENFAQDGPTSAQIMAKYSFAHRVALEGSENDLFIVFFRQSGGGIFARGLIKMDGEDRYQQAEFEAIKSSADGFELGYDPATG